MFLLFILKNEYGIDLLCFTYKEEDESCAKNFMSIVSMLVNDYHYLILDLPCCLDQAIFNLLNQSDSIHILTSPEDLDLNKTRNLIERLKTDFHFQETKIKVIINEYKLSKISYQQQLELLEHPIFATLPKMEFLASDKPLLDEPNSEYSKHRITT